MLFAVRLANEVYPPWKKAYINYDKLKKLLKENVVLENGEEEVWSEDDETRFVSSLDQELEKVYGFEAEKFKDLSDRIAAIEAKVEANANVDLKQVESELEDILEGANQLDRFRRLNFTGFTKIVKKHDRLHPRYQVRPLLHVRLNSLPFHSEDYSPLLYRLSTLYAFLNKQFGGQTVNSATAIMSSFNENTGFTTYHFWVHPENVIELKTRILRHLPVLVYNRESDDDLDTDPIISSVYLDSPNLELYQSFLETKGGSDGSMPSMRLRWHGKLVSSPEVILEQRSKDKDLRLPLKEKNVDGFLAGDRKVIDKGVRKLKGQHAPQSKIDSYERTAADLQKYILDNKLQPVMRTIYTRTAFEIPGDDRVRIMLDNDITFIREDAFNKDHPARDPDSWHRKDIDIANLDNPLSVLRKGEYAKFPHAVLEVRVKTRGTGEENTTPKFAAWIEELINSHLVRRVPQFSKFIQGVASLFAEDDRLDSLPFWLPELDHDIREDPTEVYKRNRERTELRAQAAGGPAASSHDATAEAFASDGESSVASLSSNGVSNRRAGVIGFPTRIGRGEPRLDMDSEEEEVVLPPGVTKPKDYIKNKGDVKVEAKVWLANERTFNKWLHITVLLSALTFTLYHSVEKSTNTGTATVVAYILFALTVFSGLWGYSMYLRRVQLIKDRNEAHFDNPIGPLVVGVGLLLALIVNFISAFSSRAQDPHRPVHTLSP